MTRPMLTRPTCPACAETARAQWCAICDGATSSELAETRADVVRLHASLKEILRNTVCANPRRAAVLRTRVDAALKIGAT